MILKLTPLALIAILRYSYGYDLTIDYLTCYKNKHCRAAGVGNQCYKLVEHFRGTPGYCFTTCYTQQKCDQKGRDEVCRFQGLDWQKRSGYGVNMGYVFLVYVS